MNTQGRLTALEELSNNALIGFMLALLEQHYGDNDEGLDQHIFEFLHIYWESVN